jgi:hypothetical protein
VSDYFTKFEAELRAAARRPGRAESARRRPRFGWRSRSTLLVGIALIVAAVPAVAAVTGAFDAQRAPKHPGAGSFYSLAPPCKQNGPAPSPPPSAAPAPPALTALLAALRRPQRASDRLSLSQLPHLAGVNPAAVRLAFTRADTKYFLVPTANINYSPPVPNTPACAVYRRIQRASEPGVCVWQVGGGSSGGTCVSLKRLRADGANGPDQRFDQTTAPGTMVVSGIAADGVRAVILEYPARAPARRVRIPVRGNVYAATIRRRPGLAPAVYAEGPHGIRLVQKGQQPTSRRQRGLTRRSEARDRAATGRPTVTPSVGYPHTTFTFRVRVKPERRFVYVVRVTGPPGLCREPVRPVAVSPHRSGPRRGLIRLGIGYGPLGLHRMCLGHYRGVVSRVRNGAPIKQGTVVKRFAFVVRKRPPGR